MKNLIREEAWATLDLNLESGNVLVRQEWRYAWAAKPGLSRWTAAEKAKFHGAVDRLVWSVWSRKARFLVQEQKGARPSDAAQRVLQRYGDKGLSLTFDIQKVETDPHWEVLVTKALDVAPRPRAEVQFHTRQIFLFSFDVLPHEATFKLGSPTVKNFYVAPHEFGHTLGNNDEYRDADGEFGDKESVMNLGRKLRERHLEFVRESVQTMLPGCRVTTVLS